MGLRTGRFPTPPRPLRQRRQERETLGVIRIWGGWGPKRAPLCFSGLRLWRVRPAFTLALALWRAALRRDSARGSQARHLSCSALPSPPPVPPVSVVSL